jgi:hypothetical protein
MELFNKPSPLARHLEKQTDDRCLSDRLEIQTVVGNKRGSAQGRSWTLLDDSTHRRLVITLRLQVLLPPKRLARKVLMPTHAASLNGNELVTVVMAG